MVNTTNVGTQEDLGEDRGLLQVDNENLKWRCSQCDETEEGTDSIYLNFCKRHPKKKGCKVELIDAESGEIVATSLRDAQSKGIFHNPYKGHKEEINTGVPRDGQNLTTGYFKTEKVPLSSRILMQKEIFIQEGYIPPGTSTSDYLEGLGDTLLDALGLQIAIVKKVKK